MELFEHTLSKENSIIMPQPSFNNDLYFSKISSLLLDF